jgi:hypothetical protein
MSSYPSAPVPGAVPAEDPGRTLAIVGLVLSIFALVGLIISIIAYRTSKAAGFRNGIARTGIILSCVFMVIGIISGVAQVMMMPTM